MSTIFKIDDISYIQKGEGQNIVFLHPAGLPLSGLDEHIKLLSTFSSIFAPEIYDLVKTTHPSTLNNLAEKLDLIVSKQNLKNFTLVGCSLGGGLCLSYANLFPDKVSQVIVADPIGYHNHKTLLAWSFAYLQEKEKENILTKNMTITRPSYRLLIEEFIKNPEGVIKGLSIATQTDLTNQLSDIRRPVHILWAEKDHMLPLDEGKNMAKKIPHSTLDIIPDALHFWYDDNPQLFTSYVKKYFHPSLLKKIFKFFLF